MSAPVVAAERSPYGPWAVFLIFADHRATDFNPIKNFRKCAVKILRTFFANYCHEKRVRERSNIYVSFR